jgi:hypothetical protein
VPDFSHRTGGNRWVGRCSLPLRRGRPGYWRSCS